MKEKVFTDVNGMELIVQFRKSAIYFLKKYKDEDLKQHRTGGIYIDGEGLGCDYVFSDEEFNLLCETLITAANESWKNFNPKEATSFSSDYDEYYDRDFDNNGSLTLRKKKLSIEGPYTQIANNKQQTRLIKFNKRQFESFIYDLKKYNYQLLK